VQRAGHQAASGRLARGHEAMRGGVLPATGERRDFSVSARGDVLQLTGVLVRDRVAPLHVAPPLHVRCAVFTVDRNRQDACEGRDLHVPTALAGAAPTRVATFLAGR
jgi:hypothetical protein